MRNVAGASRVLRGAIFLAAAAQYTAIFSIAVYHIYTYQFSEIAVLLTILLEIVPSLTGAYAVFTRASKLGDDKATAAMWGSLSALLAPWISLLWSGFADLVAVTLRPGTGLGGVAAAIGTFAIELVLTPMLVLYVRRLRHWARAAVLAAVILPILLLVMGMCWALRMFHGTVRPLDLSEVSAMTSLKFPPSARLIEARFHSAFRVREMVAKLEMAKADTQALMASLPSTADVSSTDKIHIDNHWFRNEPWWDPDSVREYIAVYVKAGPNVELLIDTKYRHKAIVYVLMWYSY